MIAANITARAGIRVSLAEADGRVLAEEVTADGFYPAGDRSQMDGYAVRGDAEPGIFRVAGEVPAGEVPVHPVQPGEAYRIFTGALLPPGGGRVVMQEDARREWKDSLHIANSKLRHRKARQAGRNFAGDRHAPGRKPKQRRAGDGERHDRQRHRPTRQPLLPHQQQHDRNCADRQNQNLRLPKLTN